MAGPSRVTDPDGKVWTVRRCWFPWRRALSTKIQRGELTAEPVKA
ncbi:MAG TPA: hypothetical protein VFC01_00430 [Mycobacterium sp.]|nr:hypothetical protein [Mycobacterium sp.]